LRAINRGEALGILGCDFKELAGLLEAERLYRGGMSFCAILNAKSGRCGEDCIFCAQSSVSGGACDGYPLMDHQTMKSCREKYEGTRVNYFSIVTSGGSPSPGELREVCLALRGSNRGRPEWCASLGILEPPELGMLADSGLTRYHHNVETAESFFPGICSTHSWRSRAATVESAVDAGLQVCSGGVLGLGESLEQRVEFAFQLRALGVDSIALNFFVEAPGVSISRDAPFTSSLDFFRAVVMIRLVCTDSELRICAGRKRLGMYEKLLPAAGVNGVMTGDLLTTAGYSLERDLEFFGENGETVG